MRQKTIRMTVAKELTAALLALAWWGCTDNSVMVCEPGAVQECTCPTGRGIQICAQSGMGWGQCTGCTEDGSGTGDDSEVGDMVCDPGELQTCPCAGGGEGIQECREDGSGWQSCEGCAGGDGDADADTDADTDADVDTGQDPCAYGDCVGDVCTEVDGCCETAACGSWVFPEEYGFIENYCYPVCDAANPDRPCHCDDVCKEIDTLPLCLSPGRFEAEDMAFPVAADYDNAITADPSIFGYTFSLGEDTVTLDLVEFFWEEWDDSDGVTHRNLTVWGTEIIDDYTARFLWVALPEALIESGPGEYPFVDSADALEPNFMAEIYWAEYDSADDLSDLWLESIIDDVTSTITINQICAICTTDPMDCELCDFTFNIDFYALRGKLSPPSP